MTSRCAALLCLGLLWLMSCDLQPTQPTHTSQRAALIGGTPDTRHPAIGALTSNLSPYCTGTLIAERLVLTAAHCIAAAQLQQASGGRLQFRVDFPTQDAFSIRYYDVASMHTHPQYSGNDASIDNQNDIGVVVLAQDIPNVPPLPLYTQGITNAWIGRKISFWGYGLLQTQPQAKVAGRKHFLELTLRRVLLDRFEFQDDGKSICSGDSGGPALYQVDGTLRIIGVNSYVRGNSIGSQPLCDGSGVAFRTDAYFSWLLPFLGQYGWQCGGPQDCSNCGTCTTGKCQPRPVQAAAKLCQPCQDDADCGAGNPLCALTPEGQRCTQSCTNDGCCPTGYSCQFIGQGTRQCLPSTGICPPAPCAQAQECGPGEVCHNKRCTPKVVQPTPERCKRCTTDNDCPTGQCYAFPDGGRCVQPCEGALFCPQGDTCRLIESTRLCIPNDGRCRCKTQSDCHDGFRCRDAICQQGDGGKHGDPCSPEMPCNKGHICLGEVAGTCVATCSATYPIGSPGSLCNDKQCLHSSRCYGVSGQSVCLQACQQRSDCSSGGICDSVSGLTLCTCKTDADCNSDAGCNRDTIESFGVCAPKTPDTCPTNTRCQPFVGGTYLCQANDAKEIGASCANGKGCQWGLRCVNLGDGATCARDCALDGACQPEGGQCTTIPGASLCFCQQDSQCAKDHICQRAPNDTNGICTPPLCAKDTDCPPPQSCQQGRCTQAGAESTTESTNTEPTTDIPDAANENPTTPEQTKKGCGCHTQKGPIPSLFWLLLLLLATRQTQRQRPDSAPFVDQTKKRLHL